MTSLALRPGSSRTLDQRFGLLWGASLTSGLSEGLRIVCVPLSVTAVTTSPLVLAVIVAAGYLPLVFGLPLSVVTDRFSPPVVLAGANVSRLATYVGLIVALTSGTATVPMLGIAAVALAFGQVVAEQGQQRLVPVIVPAPSLVSANGLLSSGDTSARFLVGPVLGGVLFTFSGVAPFVVAAGCVLVSLALVLRILRRYGTDGDQRVAACAPSRTRQPLWPRLTAGARLVWRYPTLRAQVLQMAFWNFSTGAVLGTLALWATSVLRVNAVGYGALAAASAVGGIAGALTANRFCARLGVSRCLKLGILGLAVTYGSVAAIDDPVLAAVIFAVNGSFSTLWSVVSVSSRQRHVPGPLLGRVQGVIQTFGRSPLAVGALCGGLLVDRFDARSPFVMSSVLFFSVCFTFVWLSDERFASEATAMSEEVDQ